MEHHVERIITHNEIQQRGEDAAIQNAVDSAWCIAVRSCHPKRSIVLVRAETHENTVGVYGVPGYTYRFTFMVDNVVDG